MVVVEGEGRSSGTASSKMCADRQTDRERASRLVVSVSDGSLVRCMRVSVSACQPAPSLEAPPSTFPMLLHRVHAV